MKKMLLTFSLVFGLCSCSTEAHHLEKSQTNAEEKSIAVLAGGMLLFPEPSSSIIGGLILVGVTGSGALIYRSTKSGQITVPRGTRTATQEEVNSVSGTTSRSSCSQDTLNRLINMRKSRCYGSGELKCKTSDTPDIRAEKIKKLQKCKSVRIDENNCFYPEYRDPGHNQAIRELDNALKKCGYTRVFR